MHHGLYKQYFFWQFLKYADNTDVLYQTFHGQILNCILNYTDIIVCIVTILLLDSFFNNVPIFVHGKDIDFSAKLQVTTHAIIRNAPYIPYKLMNAFAAVI